MRERELTGLELIRQKAEQELAKRQTLGNKHHNRHIEFSHSEEVQRRNMYELELSKIILEIQNNELHSALEKSFMATALYEHSPAGYFTLKNDGCIVELNNNGAKMLGNEKNKLPGANFINYICNDTKNVFLKFLNETIETGTQQNCKIRITIDENSSIYVYIEGFVCENKEDIFVTAIDITEKKLSEETIRTSESRLKRAELVSKTGNWELHIDTKKIYASDGAFKIYGIHNGELSYNDIKRVSLPEFRSFLDKSMKELIEENAVYDIEFKIKADDTGNIKDIHSIATFDTDKRIVFGVIRDITEQKIMENRIYESEQYYRSMVETSPDAIIIVDISGNIQFASQKTYDIFNINLGFPIKGTSLASWIAPEMREFALNRFHKIVTGLIDSEPFEYRILKNDGNYVWTEIHGSRLLGTQGQVQGMFLICRDISERKKAEEKMRESEIFIKQSQKAANIGSYKLDIISGEFKSSEVLDQILGISTDDKKTIYEWVDLLHPDDREEMVQYFHKEMILKQMPFNKDYRIVRKSDGQIKWVYGLGELDMDENGHVISLIGTIQDITERKKSEAMILLAHDQLKNLHDNLDEAIFSYDVINKQMLQISRAHEDIFGYPPSAFYENPNLWFELVIPEDKHFIEKGFPILWSGQNLHQEFRIQRPDGQIRWINANLQPKMDEEGHCIRIDGVAYDITTQKQAEEASIESEERFHMVFENVFDGIAIYEEHDDPYKRKLIECNNQYAMMAGRSREELLAIGHVHHLQISREDTCNSNRLESLAQQKAYKGSTSWIRPDGKENVIEYIGVPITWRGKSYSIGIDRDITSRIQIEAEIIASKEKAEESDRLKSTFLANMSHEIRTPLNSIIGFSELMSEPDFDLDQMQQFAKIIHDSGNNLLSIISDIMDISKIEAGLVEIRKREFSINKLLQNLYKEYSFQASKKGIELILDPNIQNEEFYIINVSSI